MLLSSSVTTGFLFKDKTVFSENRFVGELIGLRSCVWAVRAWLRLVMDGKGVEWKRPCNKIIFV